jgi:hypothetical protein
MWNDGELLLLPRIDTVDDALGHVFHEIRTGALATSSAPRKHERPN